MFKERNNERYSSHARARIIGVIADDAPLKDFSISGCCIESTTLIDITPNKTYSIEIIPEKASKVKAFTVSAEARWIRTVDYTYYIGFFIAASPKGKYFQYFVDYIAYLSSLPNSGDASTDPPEGRDIVFT